ncbi:MAG: glycosyltransferase family 87 protein [Acidocella sp.]|nr:glycosyltransferase family 87 protein [Acidocella sp.]
MKASQAVAWLCLALAAACNLLALLLDLSVWHRQALLVGSVASGDFLSFQRGAQALLHHAIPADHLPYPPPFFLLSAPFSYIPSLPGYFAWVFAGMLVLALAARHFQLGWWSIVLGMLSPPALYCTVMGQTGLFVSAVLLFALGLAESQPILAGIAAGCLVIKPQFGLLLPVCFLAARNPRAIWAGGMTVTLLCLLATALFGFSAWRMFFGQNLPAASGLLTAHAGRWQYTMVTVFMLCRSLGASLHVAGVVQAFVSAAAALGAWWLWSPGKAIGAAEKVAATLFLTVLATPYAYIYDLSALAFALLILAKERRQVWPAIALFWSFSGIYAVLSTFFFLSGALFIGAVLIAIWPRGGKIMASAPV